ncbi:DOPA 4,5-dioxygenase family protein [Rhodopila sp.]|uniref:DOPA 4,5-dioxygenase family protein n=1 Tax=Rhodopila sp. TaxID=2480087 RepID=UPI003D1092B1
MTRVTGYHAHVYYGPADRPVAERLRQIIASNFAINPGALNDDPRGPHPISQFNVTFRADQFQAIVPWLMLNRDGLDILVHPLTDDMIDDHSVHAMWLGTPVKLKLDHMQRTGYRPEQLPEVQPA